MEASASTACSSLNSAAAPQCRPPSTCSSRRGSHSRSPPKATVSHLPPRSPPPRFNFPRHVRHSRNLSRHVNLILEDQATDVRVSLRRLQALVAASPAHQALRETANLAHEPLIYPTHVWEGIEALHALQPNAPSSPLATAVLDVTVDRAIHYSRTIEKLRSQLMELHRLRQPGLQNHYATNRPWPPSPAGLSVHFSQTEQHRPLSPQGQQELLQHSQQ